MYEPYTKTIITCNGRSHDLSVIDPVKGEVTATIPLDGKPETAVSGDNGKIYVNIEDKNEITVVDIRKKSAVVSYPLGAEGPTGLAIDVRTKRLFAGCDKQLVVMKVYLSAADTEPAAPGQRPRMIPGTFGVLVVSK